MSKIPHLKPDRVIRVIKYDQIITMIPRGSKARKKSALSEIMRALEMRLERSKAFRDME